jgi:acyl carrier protein
MTDNGVESRLLDVLASVLQVPRTSLNDETSRPTIDVWDSLKHMHVMLALEDEFKIEFSDTEIARLDSVQGLVGAIAAKTRGSGG